MSKTNSRLDYKTDSAASASLKIHAGLAAAALKIGEHQAYGLWCLARSLDSAGSGKMNDADLRAAAAAVGWSDYKYRRARHCAMRLGIMRLTDDVLYLRSLEKTALALKADRVGVIPIGVAVEALATTKGLRAALRDVYLAQTANPRPISRKAIQEATGISPSTQTRLNKTNRARVNVIHNFARLVRHFNPADLAGAKSIEPSAYYKDGALWRTLPCTYEVSTVEYPRLRRGRTRKAQSALNHLRSVELVPNAAGERSNLKQARRYHETREQAFKAVKAIGKGKRSDPGELYLLARVRESTNTHGPRRIFAQWVAYPERDDLSGVEV